MNFTLGTRQCSRLTAATLILASSLGSVGCREQKNLAATFAPASDPIASDQLTEATPVSITIGPAADNFVSDDANHSSATLNTYTWPDYTIANTILMKFDVSSIPGNAIVDSAELQLRLIDADTNRPTSGDPYTLTVHKVIGKNVNVDLATGGTYDGANPWTSRMGLSDISGAYATVPMNQVLEIKSFLITQMIQDWIAAPASNYGLLISSDPTQIRDRFRTFASKEHSEPTYRPSLAITYHLPVP